MKEASSARRTLVPWTLPRSPNPPDPHLGSIQKLPTTAGLPTGFKKHPDSLGLNFPQKGTGTQSY